MAGILLAVESSTDWLSVALLSGEDVIAFKAHPESRQHAAALLPAIDQVLGETGLVLEAIDSIGIATGPGSFTSLRIGLATVKGLMLGRKIPAVGVSTLEAMALGSLEAVDGDDGRVGEVGEVGEVGDRGEVVVLLDARRDEWYAGGWSMARRVGARPVATLAEGLYSSANLVEACARGARMITPDARGWRRICEQAGRPLGQLVEGERARPRADAVGRLAARQLALGQGVSTAALEARYVRRAEAEAKRLGAPVEQGELAHLDPE